MPTATSHPSPDEIEQTIARGKKRRLPYYIIFALVLAGLAWGVMKWRAPKDDVVVWTTRALDRGDIVVTANATGTLQPRRTVTIGAEISGRIATVEVENNQTVTAGQVLATFDTTVLESSLSLARAGLTASDASVRRAVSVYEEARAEEARTLALVERGVAAAAEADYVKAATVRARADLDRTRAEAERARASVADVRTQLERAVITSPIDGVVLSRKVEPGQTVAASLQAPELFLVAEDLSRMNLNVWVDEADIGLVQAGQRATFTVSAWPGRSFDAVVETLDLAPTQTDNVVTYIAVLSVDNAEGLLRPGMTASTTIETGRQTDVLRVPNAALRFRPPVADARGGSPLIPQMRGGRGRRQSAARGVGTVHVLRDGVPVAVRVQTGRTDGRFTEVTSDELSAGMEVVVGVGGGDDARPGPRQGDSPGNSPGRAGGGGAVSGGPSGGSAGGGPSGGGPSGEPSGQNAERVAGGGAR